MFVPAVMSVADNQGTLQVCVTSLNIEADITVSLATSDGTGIVLYNQLYNNDWKSCSYIIIAFNGSDYIGVFMDLVFTAGTSNDTRKCIDIDIIDSPTIEDNEFFTVTLTTSSSVLKLGNNMTTVTIKEADSMFHR